MGFKNEFNRVLSEAPYISLATQTTDGQAPNTRIVYFVHTEGNNRITFVTFAGTPKIEEFNANNRVAFTSSVIGNDAVRVSKGTLSEVIVVEEDIKNAFFAKFPMFAGIAKQAGPNIKFYDITFDEADVIVGFNNTKRITLK